MSEIKVYPFKTYDPNNDTWNISKYMVPDDEIENIKNSSHGFEIIHDISPLVVDESELNRNRLYQPK